jgi:lectin-like protein
MSAGVACVPSNDLDTYSSTESAGIGGGASLPLEPQPSPSDGAAGASARGASSELPPTPSLDPSNGVGSAAGASGNGTSAGSGDAGDGEGPGDLPLSVDAGLPSSPNDAAPLSTCAASELAGPNGHCYFLLATPFSWDEARSACQARGLGWDLVSVRSAADSAFLDGVLTFEAWLGASDRVIEGTWAWVVDNQPFWSGNGTTGGPVGDAYTHWNPSEPNGVTTDCARALPRSFGSPIPDAPWADLACETLRGAVCEQYPAP